MKVSRDTPSGVLSFHSYRGAFVSHGGGLSTKGCEESIGRPDFTPVCTRVSCSTVFLAIPATISCRLINTCNGRNWLSLGKGEDGRVDKKNRRGEEGKSDSVKIISLFNRNAAGERLDSLLSS